MRVDRTFRDSLVRATVELGTGGIDKALRSVKAIVVRSKQKIAERMILRLGSEITFGPLCTFRDPLTKTTWGRRPINKATPLS